MSDVRLIQGDCLDVLRDMPDGLVDAVVTDPPAGIAFMGADWDRNKGGRSEWVAWLSSVLAECLRAARPGSVLLCWALPRTSHWTGTAIEDAGWSIEDRIAHHFGSGFPKHRSKLKPATEDWWLARKPGGTKWLGIEACRVGTNKPGWTLTPGRMASAGMEGYGHREGRTGPKESDSRCDPNTGRWPANLVLSHAPGCVRRGTKRVKGTNPIGPHPGKLGYRGSKISSPGHDFTDPDGFETVADYVCVEDCPIRLMGEQGGERTSGKAGRNGHRRKATIGDTVAGWGMRHDEDAGHLIGDSGSAARFFPNFDADADPFLYCPKASRAERNRGCEGMEPKASGVMQDDAYRWEYDGKGNKINLATCNANHHPTVKPLALMRWLYRLACPPGGMILDPFAGSGSTGMAAIMEGFGFVGIERDPDYFVIAERRIRAVERGEELPLFAGAGA